jgi:acyl-CoA synthetase (NDP forming)
MAAIRQLRPTKPVLFAGLDEGAIVPHEQVDELRALGVPYFPTAERALRAVAMFSTWSARALPSHVAGATPMSFESDLPSGVIPEHRAKKLLATQGIPFLPGRLAVTLEQAQVAAAAIGFPVALKAQAADLPHKSEVGGVVLGLNHREQLAEGWERLHANLARHCPGLVLDGVLVEPMAPRGIELIVGGRRDPEWGPILLVGFGGVQAEVLRDVRLLPPDVTEAVIVHELNLLHGSALLRGFRGAPPADMAAVAQLIARLGRLLRAEPKIKEIDLNPVMVYPQGQGALALDALMLVSA